MTDTSSSSSPPSLENVLAAKLRDRLRRDPAFADHVYSRIRFAHDGGRNIVDREADVARELAACIGPDLLELHGSRMLELDSAATEDLNAADKTIRELRDELVRRTELLDRATLAMESMREQIVAMSQASINTMHQSARLAQKTAEIANNVARGQRIDRDELDLITIHVAHETFCAIDYHDRPARELEPVLIGVLANIAGAFSAFVVTAITDGHVPKGRILCGDPRVLLTRAAERFPAVPNMCPHCYELKQENERHVCEARSEAVTVKIPGWTIEGRFMSSADFVTMLESFAANSERSHATEHRRTMVLVDNAIEMGLEGVEDRRISMGVLAGALARRMKGEG